MSNQSQGISALGLFATLLTVLFIGLKLTGYVAWSWVWTLSPLWLPFTIGWTVVTAMAWFTKHEHKWWLTLPLVAWVAIVGWLS